MIELWDFGEPWNKVRDALIWLGSGGSNWPKANEDQIRELATAWQTVGERLQSGLTEANSAAADLMAAWGGDGGTTFAQQWQHLGHEAPQMLVDIILNGYDGNPSLVGSLEQSALDIEYDKISTLIEVAVVIIEIFVIIVTAWLAFWAAWGAAAARIAVGRATIWTIMKELIANAIRSFGQRGLSEGLKEELKRWAKHTIKFEVAKEIGAETGVDITAQLVQKYGLHTRTNWDVKKTVASGLGGALGAGLSFATPIGEKIAGNITNKVGKGLVNLGTRAVDEFITEIGAEFGANGIVYNNWKPNFSNLGNRIGSGMVRDYTSEKANLSGLALDLGKAALGLETSTQATANAARQAAQNAANQAATAAQNARRQATAAQQAATVATQQAQAARQRADDANAAANAAAARYGVDSTEAAQARQTAEAANRQAQIAQRGAAQANVAAQVADTSATQAEEAARQARADADRIPAPAGAPPSAPPGAPPTAPPDGTTPPQGTPPTAPPDGTAPPAGAPPAAPPDGAAPPLGGTPPTAAPDGTAPPQGAPSSAPPDGTAPPQGTPPTAPPQGIPAAQSGTVAAPHGTPAPTVGDQNEPTGAVPPHSTSRVDQGDQPTTTPDDGNAPPSGSPPRTDTPTATPDTDDGHPGADDDQGTAGVVPARPTTQSTTDTRSQRRTGPASDTDDDQSTEPDDDETTEPENAGDDTGDGTQDDTGETAGSPKKVSARLTIAIAQLVLNATAEAQAAAHTATRANALAQALASPDGRVQITGPDSLTLGDDLNSDEPDGPPGQPPLGSQPLQGLLPDDAMIPATMTDVQRHLLALGVRPGEAPPVHPHPAGTWIGTSNDGGLTVPGRSVNCLLWAPSVHSTYYGHPSVAPANGLTVGHPAAVLQAWAGAPFATSDPTQGLADVEERLRQALPDDADAGPMAFVAVVDPRDTNAAHMYAVFVRREAHPTNPGETQIVFYYADHGSTTGEPNRPDIDPNSEISSIIFDHTGAVVPPDTETRKDSQLAYALVAGRPTSDGTRSLLAEVTTLLATNTTADQRRRALDAIEEGLRDMGLKPGRVRRRWSQFQNTAHSQNTAQSSATTAETEAFLQLIQEPGWRAAYEQALAASPDVARAFTGATTASAARTIALATIFATSTMPTYAGDQAAVAVVSAVAQSGFHFQTQPTVSVDGNELHLTFEEMWHRTVRVEYGLLAADAEVELLLDGDEFRMVLRHGLNLSDVAVHARLQVLIARELSRVRNGETEYRSNQSDVFEDYYDILQDFTYRAVSDIGQALAANRPDGAVTVQADRVAAQRLADAARAEEARVMQVLLAAVALDPSLAPIVARLIAAAATSGVTTSIARLVGDLTLSTASGRTAQRQRTRTAQLMAASLRIAGSRLADELSRQPGDDELASILDDAVDRAVFIRNAAQVRMSDQSGSPRGVLFTSQASFTSAFVTEAEQNRQEILDELDRRRTEAAEGQAEPSGITLPGLSGRGATLDVSLRSAVIAAAARLGFAAPGQEAAMLAALGPTLAALSGLDGDPSTADTVDAARAVLRETLAHPDRVSLVDRASGDAALLFQRQITDAQGNTQVVGVTVRVFRSLEHRVAHVSQVQVTSNFDDDFGRPTTGEPPKRVRVTTRRLAHRATDVQDDLYLTTPASATAAVQAAVTQVAPALGLSVTEVGQGSNTYDITLADGTGPIRVRVRPGSVRGNVAAEVRPPRGNSRTWEVRVATTQVSRTGLALGIAEALGLTVATELDQRTGRPDPEQARRTALAARLAVVAAARAASPPGSATPRSDRLSAEAHSLIDDLGVRLDQPGYEARRAEIASLVGEAFGPSAATAVDDLLTELGRPAAALTDPRERRHAEAARRATEQRAERQAITDILLDQQQSGLVTGLPALAQLRGTGPALTGAALAAHLAATLGSIERGLTLTAQSRDGVTVTHDALSGPISVRVQPGSLPAGTGAHLSIDLGTRTVTIIVAEGTTADVSSLHLVGALAQVVETVARSDKGKHTRPADVLGRHPLTRRTRRELDGVSPADVGLAAQIEFQAKLLLADPQSHVHQRNLLILLARAGVTPLDAGHRARQTVLRNLLQRNLADRIDAILGVPEHVWERLRTALLPDTVDAPKPTVSQGRRGFRMVVPATAESTGSLSTPPHKPLHPFIARRLGSRRARRFERRLAASRFWIDRLGTDRMNKWASRTLAHAARTAMWVPKTIMKRPLSLLTTKVRHQRPWRVFAFSSVSGVTRVRLPDGTRRFVFYTKTTTSKAVNRLGGLRFSSFTGFPEDAPKRGENPPGPDGPPPIVLFPQGGHLGLDVLNALVHFLQNLKPFMTFSAKDGSGLGTPMPIGNSDSDSGRTIVRAHVVGTGGTVVRSNPSHEQDHKVSATLYVFVGTFISVTINLGFGEVKSFYLWLGGQGTPVSGSADYDKVMAEVQKFAAAYRDQRTTVDPVRAAWRLRKALLRHFRDAGLDVNWSIQPLVFEAGYSHRYLPAGVLPSSVGDDIEPHGPFTQSNDQFGVQTNPNVSASALTISLKQLGRILTSPFRPISTVRAIRAGFGRSVFRSWVARQDVGQFLDPASLTPTVSPEAAHPGSDPDLELDVQLSPDEVTDLADRYRVLHHTRVRGLTLASEMARIEALAEVSPELRAALEVARSQPPLPAATPPNTLGPDPVSVLLAGGQVAPPSTVDLQRHLQNLGVRPGEQAPLHPHPGGTWLNTSNDGGLTVPGRNDNCLTWLVTAYHTYFGRPAVAPSNLTGQGFAARILETWAGTAFQAQPDGVQGLAEIEEQLRQALPPDADAGPMAFVIVADPRDRNAAHGYAVFVRRESDPDNPGQTKLVFYYADHGSTTGDVNRPPIDPDAKIYSMVFDQTGTAVQAPATTRTSGRRLDHARIAGRPADAGETHPLDRVQGKGAGPAYPMTMASVRAVAAKYGIDLTGLRITIDKSVRGWCGRTLRNGSIILFRDAFRSEEDLARTLVHERLHHDELAAGRPYPANHDDLQAWEDRAYDHEDDWWDNQSVRPEG